MGSHVARVHIGVDANLFIAANRVHHIVGMIVRDEVDKGALELAVGAVLRLELDIVDARHASKEGIEHVINRGVREVFVDGRDIDRGDYRVFGQH